MIVVPVLPFFSQFSINFNSMCNCLQQDMIALQALDRFISAKPPEYAHWGVIVIRSCAPVKIVFHFPETESGQAELMSRVASIHSDYVNFKLKRMDCPNDQKQKLLNAVIHSVKASANSKVIPSDNPR